MSENGFHFDLPPALSEDELLGWVEGTLPRDQSLRVESLLAEHPRLGRIAAGMRADRLALATLPEFRPPADLMARVEATMERQALLGLADSELMASTRPVAAVRPVRVLGRVSPVRLGIVGMAAGLLLSLGVGAYFAMNALQSRDSGPILADSTDAAPMTAPAPEAEEARPLPALSPELAARKTWSPALLEYSEAPPTLTDGMPIERALALAEEGRLIVRVRSESLLRASQQLGAMGEATRLRSDWRVAGLADGPVADLFGSSAIGPIELAGSGAGPGAGSAADRARIEVEAPTPPNVFIAEARLTPESLRALLDGLARRGQSPSFEASFEEIADPAPLEDDAVDPRDVVWWTGTPSDWAPWIKVPVVVEAGK